MVPSPIDPQLRADSLEALEWPGFLARSLDHALTAPGRERLERLARSENWATTPGESRDRQLETAEMQGLLERDSLWSPLRGLTDPSAPLERLARGGALEPGELHGLRRWVAAAETWSSAPRDELRAERFRRALARLPALGPALREIERVLTPEGELSDRASAKLGQLNGEIRALKREIASRVDHLVRELDAKGVLQDRYSDERDGRFVLPVRISHQHEVEGVVYEASVSRQTVFIEPQEVSNLNNRMRRLQNDRLEEALRILREVSEKLRPDGPAMALAADLLSHWDEAQARARAGRMYDGRAIEIAPEKLFWLRGTAHPLLWGGSLAPEKIIRNEVDFGEPARALLITGPNTGGKTVLLKTLGLAAICARTGFPFPASEPPRVPFFRDVLADFGDPQSLQNHLSSFSGHVKRLCGFLAAAVAESLILLDELNSATDPEEGAALGRAFLETLMERGAMLVATTHDPHLKALSAGHARIVAASMAFDEGSREPTYRMVLGVPGRSRALETAERLGVPADVLAKAHSYLSRDHRSFEGMLARLETDSQVAARARIEAEALRAEALKLQAEWRARAETSVTEMLEKARLRLRRLQESAEDQVREALRQIGEAKQRRELDSTRARLAEAFSETAARTGSAITEDAPELVAALGGSLPSGPKGPAQDAPAGLMPGAPVNIGDSVRVPKWKSTGKVLAVQRDGKQFRVALGTLQVTLSRDELEPLSEPERMAAQAAVRANAPRAAARAAELARPFAPGNSLDVRGQRLDDALAAIERYLDVAYRSGAYVEVTIVHGLGTGALREGARKLLRSLPYVKQFQDAGSGQGGTGATLVEFER